MKVNGMEIEGKAFAFDGCHKIYIIETKEDELNAKECGYTIYPIANLADAYENSCDLKFISNWQLTKEYVPQFEDAIFED